MNKFCDSNKTNLLLVTTLSLIPAFVVSLLVETLAIKIIYFALTAIMTFVILFTLIFENHLLIEKSFISVGFDKRKQDFGLLILFVLASLCIIFGSMSGVTINSTSIWASLVSMSQYSFARFLSAIFVACLFQGLFCTHVLSPNMT